MKRLMLAMVCLAAGAAFAEVTVSGIFSNNMVLQRGKPVPVWGKAAPGEKIKVEFAGQSVEATANAKGDWTATLAPMEANTNSLTLSVSSTLNSQPTTLNFTNVLVGDVWLVSGQSNSEMSFGWGIINGKEEIAKSKDYPNIRQIKFNHATSPVPRKFRACNQGQWKVCSEKALNNITAMGYFFARDINAKTGVPIGLLDDNWSGCAIEPFICREGYAAVPAFTNRLAGIDKAAKDYIASVDKFAEAWLAGDRDAQLPGVGNGPSQQHNAMIEPIVRFPIAGALWYQGCTNGGDGMIYADKLRALVAGWRAKWGYEFPFYIVQLASFTAKTTDPAGGNGYARIRNAMRVAAQTIPRSGLAVAIDIGNAKDIHPKNKRDVGERLARWALRDVYGDKNIVVSGPLYTGMKVEDKAIRVSFDYADGMFAGVKGPDMPGVAPTNAVDGVIKGFAIAGADKKWFWANAKIDGKSVIVSALEVAAPVAVRYAHRANPMGDCNLYNAAGLPASPFRTDNW